MYPYMKEIKSSITAFVAAWVLILVPIFGITTVASIINPQVTTE